jgi:Ca2+-binding RTX toxin-like protein
VGGKSWDIVDYDPEGFRAAGGVTVDLMLGTRRLTGHGTFDRLAGVEDVWGTRFADVLRGDTRANDLDGWRGNDVLQGLAGPDTIFGGQGNDDLDGGTGDDSLAAGVGADYLDGGAGSDLLVGMGGVDRCVNGEDVHTCEVLTAAFQIAGQR